MPDMFAIRPGDTLIVEVSDDQILSKQEVAEIKAGLLRMLPGLHDVVMLTNIRPVGVWRGPEAHEASRSSDGTGVCVHCGYVHA